MKRRDWKIAPLLSASACLAAAYLPFGVAQAQNAGAQPAPQATDEGRLEEVVITAERRVADIQKSANSVTVRTGTDLQDEGRYSLQQILEDVPGVGAGPVGAGADLGGSDTAASVLTIRGIPSNGGGSGSAPTTLAPAAAVYVDGVYEGVGGGYDIDRVEVLRGPQGTLYGRSATSGVVAIHTANPALDKVGGNASIEFGNYSLLHYSAALNLPVVSDVLAVRVAGQRYERDGYLSKEGGAVSTTDGKIKVLYQPNQDLSVLLGAALQNNAPHTGGVTTSLSAPNTFSYNTNPINNPVNVGHNKHRQYWGEINWNLGFATLTWQPAYRTFRSDTTSARLLYTNTGAGLDFRQSSAIPKDNIHTEELRLTSATDSNLIWLAGLFYYDQAYASRGRNDARGVLGPPGASATNFLAYDANLKDKHTSDVGVYGQATYNLSDAWRLTGGLRYDDTKISVDEDYCSDQIPTLIRSCGSLPNSFDNAHRRYKNTTFKARVEHDLTAQNLLYASVSTGFSPGDVALSQDSNNVPYVLDLQAETLTAYEVGSKNRFLDDTLQVNGAVYYYDYGAYQATNVNLNLGSTPAPITATVASPAKVLGAELETIYQLTADDRLGLSLAYTDARFVDKTGTAVLLSGSPVPDNNGAPATFASFFVKDQIPGVVPFSANLSYDRNFTLPGSSKLTLHGDARYLSAHYLTNVNQLQAQQGVPPYVHVDAEVVTDANLTWASSGGNYSVTGYVRNIGDNRYKAVVTVVGSSYTGVPYDPRTYGIVLNARF